MNQEIKERWVAKLRSGEIRQATGKLRRVNSDGTEGMCCLGVLCELAVEAGALPPGELSSYSGVTDDGAEQFYAYEGQSARDDVVLPRKVQVWADVDQDNPLIASRLAPDGEEVGCLAALNDHGGDFNLIADVIEAEL